MFRLSEVAQGLQHNWMVVSICQLVSRSCVLLHTSSALCAWLVRQCDEFVSPISGNVVVQRVPSPVSPPPPGPHPVPRPTRSQPANPFSTAAPTVAPVPREAIVEQK